MAPLIPMATPTTSLSLLSRPSRPPPVLRRRRNFQPAAALVNQSTRQPGSHGSPSTPLLAALSPAPLTAATSPCLFRCPPGTSEAHWRQALGTLADPRPQPRTHGTTYLSKSLCRMPHSLACSLGDANPKAPNSRHTGFAPHRFRAQTSAGGVGDGDGDERGRGLQGSRTATIARRLLGVVVSRA